ncbi:MAG: ExbD/TolR family protein [Leptospirales bacterium]
MRLFRDNVEESPRARIELIPMIDIMFFLLVVFIFISISLIKLNGVTVDLPKAADHPLQKQPKIVNISIDEDGHLFLEKDPVNRASLKNRLLALSADKTAPYEIIISGDKDSHLQRLVDVMDLTNTLGFSNVSIRTGEEH